MSLPLSPTIFIDGADGISGKVSSLSGRIRPYQITRTGGGGCYTAPDYVKKVPRVQNVGSVRELLYCGCLRAPSVSNAKETKCQFAKERARHECSVHIALVCIRILSVQAASPTPAARGLVRGRPVQHGLRTVTSRVVVPSGNEPAGGRASILQ